MDGRFQDRWMNEPTNEQTASNILYDSIDQIQLNIVLLLQFSSLVGPIDHGVLHLIYGKYREMQFTFINIYYFTIKMKNDQVNEMGGITKLLPGLVILCPSGFKIKLFVTVMLDSIRFCFVIIGN